MAAKWYGNALVHCLTDGIDLTDGSVKVALCTSSYTPDQDADEFFDDITNEVSGTGYTAGGETLTSVAVTYTGASNVCKLDADDVTWSTATITARIAVYYYDTGTAGTSPLICYDDAGSDVSSTAGDFKLTVNTGGIATITAS